MRVVALALLMLGSLAAAEFSGTVVDVMCRGKDLAGHTRECALTCAKSGFGIIDKDGTYLKFDAKGNAEAMKLLQRSTKKDHLRVNITGEKQGGVIQVQSLKM